MNNIKIFHITTWYPNEENVLEGNFIKEHFNALNKKCYNKLIHLEVKYKKSKLFTIVNKNLSNNESSLIIYSSIRFWFFKELIGGVFLLYLVFKYKVNKHYHLLNIHIAYPNLTFLHLFYKLIKVPIIVTEHWSAYKENFGLPLSTKKLKKIKRIFFNNLKVITVSKALADDIIKFSSNYKLNYYVVPNVVSFSIDKNIQLNLNSKDDKKITFFCLAFWREIKNPFLLFDAFFEISKSYPDVILKVGGAGPLLPKMVGYINNLGLQNKVVFTGQLTKYQVCNEMQSSTAFLHCSKYETFSVVCAEALCIGLPVISSNIPAIAEYINSSNGMLVPNDNVNSWINAIRTFISNYTSYNKSEIANSAFSKFSSEAVAEKYFTVLNESVLQYKKRVS